VSLKHIVKLPWWARMRAKLVLSRLPVSYRFWQRMQLFQHGLMEDPAYAWNIFRNHWDAVGLKFGSEGFRSLEMGPGDTLFSALIAYAYGCRITYLVDVGEFARHDIPPYHAMSKFLAGRGMHTADIRQAKTLEDIVASTRAEYLTQGLESLRTIPDSSVDFIWSNAVLEHIRRSEFLDIMIETRRILKPGGAISHQVDLRDHLGGALNNLRFTQEEWESDRMSSAGFYTNRIRYNEMLAMFVQAGFHVEVDHRDIWEQLPTPRSKMQPEFASIDEFDLRVMGFAVVLTPEKGDSNTGG